MEETHALAEKLARLEQELTHLTAFVRRHARSTGPRPPGEPIVPFVNVGGLAGSEPPVEDVIISLKPPVATETESVNSIPTTPEAPTEASETGGSGELEDGDQRTHSSNAPSAPAAGSWSCPTIPPNTPAFVFIPTSAGSGSDSFSIRPNLLPLSFLSDPDNSPSKLAKMTNAQLAESLNDLRRIMECIIHRQQIANETLEGLGGRVPVQQKEGLGVSGLANHTQAFNHISQSLGTIVDRLRASSNDDLVEAPAPSRTIIPFDEQSDATVLKAIPQTRLAPLSPLPQPPSTYLAHNPTSTSPPSSSSAAYPLTHVIDEPLQRPSIWKPRARRLVPRRVFSEPASSTWQTTGGLRGLEKREREQAPGDSRIPSIASRRPSLPHSQSPDRTAFSGAQYEASVKPKVSTSVRPTVCCVQLRANPPKCLMPSSTSVRPPPQFPTKGSVLIRNPRDVVLHGQVQLSQFVL